VIAFPKTQRGNDLMTGAPAVVNPEQLLEVHIASVKK
jgi:aspartyl-tRNA synthetase